LYQFLDAQYCSEVGRAAINLLTNAWTAEYGPSGVRINAVNSGPARTEGTDAMGEVLEQLAAGRRQVVRLRRTK